MGWAGGSGLMSRIIAALKPAVPDDEAREGVYVALIRAFQDADCDTLMECFDDGDPAFEKAYVSLHPHEGGYQAAEAGKTQEANPYPAGSHAASEWAEGWEEYHAENSE